MLLRASVLFIMLGLPRSASILNVDNLYLTVGSTVAIHGTAASPLTPSPVPIVNVLTDSARASFSASVIFLPYSRWWYASHKSNCFLNREALMEFKLTAVAPEIGFMASYRRPFVLAIHVSSIWLSLPPLGGM